ncbi:hypothetical protein FDI40_gp637 [Agrobacterium phage Atu_ph07]|uniref:Uncharacterized protein n=1 Tax=Agrobacterium phage Atu_ph07 TaxID=2024264 RepID=A0A2L0V0V9_9CAUD|nr:hypothetical protein FDI40_gp637 [Agrobacterium phage Atu_ph07]AUZ95396.1 hypothetical protein [Agrobacterium phage Atu_ph07]
MVHFVNDKEKETYERLSNMTESDRLDHLKKNDDDLKVWNSYYIRRNWPDNVRPMLWDDFERVESLGINVDTNEVVVMPTVDKSERIVFENNKSPLLSGFIWGIAVVVVAGGTLSILDYFLN